jgi:hypothetical protein
MKNFMFALAAGALLIIAAATPVAFTDDPAPATIAAMAYDDPIPDTPFPTCENPPCQASRAAK